MADDESPDFKYILRLANTEVDGNRPIVLALTGVPGVGLRLAQMLADLLEVPRTERAGNLSDAQVEQLGNLLENLSDHVPTWALNRQSDFWTGEDLQLMGPEVDMRRREDINRMRMIRSYRGIRHETGQRVRGQRTRNNGRTGLQVGVTRRAAKGEASASTR